MEDYAGLDVSLKSTSVCIVDGGGRIVRETTIASEPEALVSFFRPHGVAMARIGLEAGPLSQWLYAKLKAEGLPAELIETRHVRAAPADGASAFSRNLKPGANILSAAFSSDEKLRPGLTPRKHEATGSDLQDRPD